MAFTYLVLLALLAGGASTSVHDCPTHSNGCSFIQITQQQQSVFKSVVTENAEVVQEELEAASLKKKCMAEFIAMTLFVVFGCGSAMGIAKEPGSAWIFQVALTFGLAITVLASAIGHYSGGQINCAVTFGLLVAGQIGAVEAICIVLSQLAGSIMGAGLLSCVFPTKKDLTGALGSNAIDESFSKFGALLAEFLGTFLLMYTVLETAVNPATKDSHVMACLVIGLSVFLAHSVLIPIDGCSINPTRSFGPALVAKMRDGADTFSDMWVFWVGPLLGAASAAGVYRLMTA